MPRKQTQQAERRQQASNRAQRRQRARELEQDLAEREGIDQGEITTQQQLGNQTTTRVSETAEAQIAESRAAEAEIINPEDLAVDDSGPGVGAQIAEEGRGRVADRVAEQAAAENPLVLPEDVDAQVGPGGVESIEVDEGAVEQRRAAIQTITSTPIRVGGDRTAGNVDPAALEPLAEAGLGSDRTFISRQGNRVSITLYNQGADGGLTRPTSGVPNLEFQTETQNNQQLAEFVQALGSLPDQTLDALGPGTFQGDSELQERAAERDARRRTRNAVNDALDDAGVSDELAAGATASGRIIVQDRDTNLTGSGSELSGALEELGEQQRIRDVSDPIRTGQQDQQRQRTADGRDPEQRLREQFAAGELEDSGVDEDLAQRISPEDVRVQETEGGERRVGLSNEARRRVARRDAAASFDEETRIDVSEEDVVLEGAEEGYQARLDAEARERRQEDRQEIAEAIGVGASVATTDAEERFANIQTTTEVEEVQTREEAIIEEATGGLTRDIETREEELLGERRGREERFLDRVPGRDTVERIEEALPGRSGEAFALGAGVAAVPEPTPVTEISGGAIAAGAAITGGALLAREAARNGELDVPTQEEIREIGIGSSVTESELEATDDRRRELEVTDPAVDQEVGLGSGIVESELDVSDGIGETTVEQRGDETVVPSDFPLPGRDVPRRSDLDRPERVNPRDIVGSADAATGVSIGQERESGRVDSGSSETEVITIDQLIEEAQRGSISEQEIRRRFPTGASAVVGRGTDRIEQATRSDVTTVDRPAGTGTASGTPGRPPLSGVLDRQQRAQRPAARVGDRFDPLATGRTGVGLDQDLGVGPDIATDVAQDTRVEQMEVQEQAQAQRTAQQTAQQTQTGQQTVEETINEALPETLTQQATGQGRSRGQRPRFNFDFDGAGTDEDPEDILAEADEVFDNAIASSSEVEDELSDFLGR